MCSGSQEGTGGGGGTSNFPTAIVCHRGLITGSLSHDKARYTDDNLRTSSGAITHNDCVLLVLPPPPHQLLTATTVHILIFVLRYYSTKQM